MALVPRILELIRANGQQEVRVYVGGIIPEKDASHLLEMGVSGVYGPGTSTEKIAADIRAAVQGNPIPG